MRSVPVARSGLWMVLALIVGALVPRLAFLSDWPANLDADEALIGVQAGEILHGRFSLYLSGQAYMGTLQSLLAAPLLAITGGHPAVVRLSPLLWILPGFLALVALDRRGGGFLSRGCGRRMLALVWFLPPAVLFLAGIKARGGTLEGLVLGLWSVVLAWPPAAGAARWRHSLARALSSGVLLGLAMWTHDQALLVVPVIVVLLLRWPGRARVGVLLAAIGWVLGYLPLWLPRVASFGLGPPGVEGAGLGVAAGAIPGNLSHLLEIMPAICTTHPRLFGGGTAWAALFTVLLSALGGYGVWGGVRSAWATAAGCRPRDRVVGLMCWSPALTVSLWLALGTIGALLVSRDFFEDEQWFRYTLGASFLVVVSAAHGLRLFPRRIAAGLASILGLLAILTLRAAVPAWEFPFMRERVALARSLQQEGLNRVSTAWSLAYPIRLFSGGHVMAVALTPPRFPDAIATVDFSSRSVWVDIAGRRKEAPDFSEE